MSLSDALFRAFIYGGATLLVGLFDWSLWTFALAIVITEL